MRKFQYEAPFGIDTIKQIIPHRYPFLLVDGITEMGEDFVRGFKNLSITDEVFQGHFPHHAVYPGVLQIELMAQVGACWILSIEENVGKTAYLMTVEAAKFRRPLEPGHVAEVYGNITNIKSRTGRLDAKITCDGRVASEATILFAFQKEQASA
jgi:3-hydroxymyristoyl/3-hydroxydecanoyl-(acyl carrier protein) dehydratase